jgi:hypothetical protein
MMTKFSTERSFFQCTAVTPQSQDTASNLARLSTSSGSCDVSTRNLCIDYATDFNAALASQDCSAATDGVYSAQSCATRNVAKTRAGLCVLVNIGYALATPSANAIIGASYYAPAYSSDTALEHCKKRFECTEAVNATFSAD